MLFSRKKWQLLILYSIGILFFFFLYRVRLQLGRILSPFLLAMVFAYLLNPLVNFLEEKKINRLLAVVIVYVFFIGIIVFLAWSILPIIIAEFSKLISDLPYYTEQVQNSIIQIRESSKNQLPEGINTIIDDNLNRIGKALITSVESVVMLVVGFFSRILNIIMVPVLAFYFLKDKEGFKRTMIHIIPQRWKTQILQVSKDIDRVIGRFIRGQIIVAAFVGVLTTSGLYILNIKYALVIGLIAGISNVIPYFGPVIGAVPAIVIAFIQNPVKVLWVIILFLVIQQIESGIVSPKVIGSSIGVHPVAVILSLVIGGSFYGIIGMLLAVPVAAVLKVIALHIINTIATTPDAY